VPDEGGRPSQVRPRRAFRPRRAAIFSNSPSRLPERSPAASARNLTPRVPAGFFFFLFSTRLDATRDRVIHGRSKTLMRHCRIGHRRGSFKDKSYRDRVHAVLESVYGPTFEEGAWWYRNPDEDAFFARVFSMASGVDVTATQAARVFVKNGETRKIELDETAMRDAGVSIEKVAALYEKTPAAAWIAETRGERAPREAIVVPPLVFGEEADEVNVNAPSPHPGSARRASASRATESSASGASESAFRAGSAPEELRERRASALAGAAPPEASDEDDDDATVVADEFNDDVDAFLDEAEDALPALPAGDAETRNENGDALFFGKENLDDVGLSAGIGVLPDSLGLGDLFASQPTTADAEALLLKEDASEKSSMPAARRETCAAARDGFGADTFPFRENDHVYESLDAAPFERLLTLGAVRKNMSFLGATAASAVSARARSELETHLAHVDRILRDSAPHDFSELFCSQ
jgi:hypothetical protein